MKGLLRFFALCVVPALAQVALAEQYTVRLASGWNLVAMQVAPTSSDPNVVFGPLGATFEMAWHMDPQTGVWSQYAREGVRQPDQEAILPLSEVGFGKAYWIFANAATDWLIEGEVPSDFPAVVAGSGWRMIGVPTGPGGINEELSIYGTLAGVTGTFDTILRWEAGLYEAFTVAGDNLDDFTVFDPERAYWVNVTSDSFVLDPTLVTSVRADEDVEPYDNFPSFEDLNLSGSSIPLDASSQTHVVFLSGEDTQQIGLSNSGGGVLLWELSWEPDSEVSQEEPWLELSAMEGVTTFENDIITLSLNRKSLVAGSYRGVLRLNSTGGNREFQVVANVPPLEGEWRGEAIIATVNGKRNPVPDVDLHLSFTEDPTIPGLLRGLIDSSQAAMWPVDVPLVGHVMSNDGNQFALSGAYILGPGDQNNPPYDQLGDEDVDWLADGVFDDLNPFPWPIYRAVQLNGFLESASPSAGYRITGAYAETVVGMSEQPIRLEGRFTIDRESPEPYANRNPNVDGVRRRPFVVSNEQRLARPKVIGGEPLRERVPVDQDLILQDIQLTLRIVGVPGSDLSASLVAPNGRRIRLHDQQPVSESVFNNVTYPTTRVPMESLEQLIVEGVPTEGEWIIELSSSAGGGELRGWNLRLAGQPVYSISGNLRNSDGLPVSGEVWLSGQLINQSITTASDGSFRFDRVAGIPSNFIPSASGYLPNQSGLVDSATIPVFPDVEGSEAQRWIQRFRPLPGMPVPSTGVPGFGLNGTQHAPVFVEITPDPAAQGQVVLAASTTSGPAPLTVDFSLVDVRGAIPQNAALTWDFGDGTTQSTTGALPISHRFDSVSPEGYTVTVRGHGAVADLSETIYVMPSPGHTPYAFNFFAASFTGGGSLPADFQPPENTQAPEAVSVELMTVQHATAVSFDLDRPPYTTPENRDYAQDGLSTTLEENGAGGFRDEDFNYSVEVGSGPGQWSLAEDVGYVIEDNRYEPFPKTGDSKIWIDPSSGNLLPRYQMICNIGPVILPPPNAEVFSANMLVLPQPQLSPLNNGLARSRHHVLITGPMAQFVQLNHNADNQN